MRGEERDASSKNKPRLFTYIKLLGYDFWRGLQWALRFSLFRSPST
jgi:hypothetical protein